MLQTLYKHFLVLYAAILPKNPTIASEHALKQEEEVYKKSGKLTYRNVSAHLCSLLCLTVINVLGSHSMCCGFEAPHGT